MKPPAQGIEAIAVRRAKLADADKVRYRVYSSPEEFIAVIAESALMAVKVSGVTAPYKIMRDLPTEGIAIEAKKMAQREDVPERVKLATTHLPSSNAARRTEMPEVAAASASLFVPMGVAELSHKGGRRARILPPDLLNQIIEEHARAAPPAPAAAPAKAEVQAAPPASAPVPAPEPPAVMQEEPAVMDEETAILSAPLEISQEEIVSRLADELLPSGVPTILPKPEPSPDMILTPEEVERLLHE